MIADATVAVAAATAALVAATSGERVAAIGVVEHIFRGVIVVAVVVADMALSQREEFGRAEVPDELTVVIPAGGGTMVVAGLGFNGWGGGCRLPGGPGGGCWVLM